ncbi:hypothetical protein BCR44DRAFT_33345 [Catenaria anguillulae PL171]|uniref:Uncharacterized protein n=1 Tax=Catenaria anguillulae PL171 TaxID=765915 RepID=A0A1Y2I0W3_9FUNG|nr:hypothetical protein BCR44DRAFT_33345 [Catenaria anguillulae PL171]
MDYSPPSPLVRDPYPPPSSHYPAANSPRGTPPTILSPSVEMGPSSWSGTPQQSTVVLPYIPAEERTPQGDSQSPAEARYKRLSGEDGRQLRALDEIFRLD